jgi:hypothetical protein
LAFGLVGCAVQTADDSADPNDACEAPATAEAPEALSAIDCNQHQDTGYSSGNAFAITVVTVDGKPVEMSTANAYYVMAQAAAAQGVTLQIVSGFRTMAEQQYLYSCYVNCNCNSCNLAAKPGYSNHQSGHALDLNTSSPGVYDWLSAHAGAYGFERTVPSEAWHWEWWGGGPGGGPCGTCTPHCEGSKIVGQDCGVGDCGVFGATCVDDQKGVRCASVFCPAQGQKKVCVNDELIGDCNDGAISTGDCSVYGAVCVDDQKGARCALVFCADQPATAHDVCLPTGQLGHCNDVGGMNVEDCPASKPCAATAAGAKCGGPDPQPAASGGAAGAPASGSGGTTSGAGWGGGEPIEPASSQGKSNGAHAGSESVQGGCACSSARSERDIPLGAVIVSLLGLLRIVPRRSRRRHSATA